MQVRELLPMIALLKTQRVRLYHSPDGALIGDFRREDILPAVCGRNDEKEHGERALLNFGHTCRRCCK